MNVKALLIATSIVCILAPASFALQPSATLPVGCKIKEGSKKKGYSLTCKKELSKEIPFWTFRGSELIPLDEESNNFYDRRLWTQGHWELREMVLCMSKCHPPVFILFYRDYTWPPPRRCDNAS